MSDHASHNNDDASYESISAPFIRYPIATSLLMTGILFVGLVAYPLLPVAPFAAGGLPNHPGVHQSARRKP